MADKTFDYRSFVEGPQVASTAKPTTFDYRSFVEPPQQEEAPNPLLEDARAAVAQREAAYQQQVAKPRTPEMFTQPDDYAQLKMAAPIAGAYGVLDNAINFLPGITQQMSGIPASQRKAVNLKGDFENLMGLDALKRRYPKAYDLRTAATELVAPMPTAPPQATLRGEALVQGLLGAGVGLFNLPGQALKQHRDITANEVFQNAAIGFGAGAAIGTGVHWVGSLFGERAAKAGADDIAAQTLSGESNLDAGAVDEDILQALGLVAEKPKKPEFNAMAAAMKPPEYARNPKDILKQPFAPKPHKGHIPLHAFVNISLDKEMKANIAAAEAKVAEIRRAKQDVADFEAAAAGLQEAVQTKADSAARRVQQVRAQLDNEAHAQELLDTALQHPLSFKKFRDGGITWTPHSLSDEKLAEYSKLLPQKAEGAKGATKNALIARAEAVNSEIARRADALQNGKPSFVSEEIPTQPVQEVTPETVLQRPMTIQQVREWDAERHVRAFEPLQYETRNFGKSKQRDAGDIKQSTGIQAQDLSDSQLEEFWQELQLQLRMLGERKPKTRELLESQQGIVSQEQMRRAEHVKNGWQQNWTKEDGINYSRLSEEELLAAVQSGDETKALHAMNELDAREVKPYESFTPQQADEAAQVIAEAPPLVPERIGYDRALEGVAVNELVAGGVITPEVGEMAHSVALAAYARKRLEIAIELLKAKINELKGVKTTTKPSAGATEGQLRFTREGSEELAQQRSGKDVKVSERQEHLRATVGDGNANVLLRQDVANSLELNQPLPLLQAQLKAVRKAFKAADDTATVEKQRLLPYFSELRTPRGFIVNVPLTKLGEAEVKVAIEHVRAHDVKEFSDPGLAAKWADTIEKLRQNGQAWLKNPVILTPAQKAQIIAGVTTLGAVLNDQAAHAAGSPILTANSAWLSICGTPQGMVALALSGINPIGRWVARNIMEGGLGNVKLVGSGVLLGRTIRLADNFRNTWERVAALTRIVEDLDRNLWYQQQMTREYFQLSSQLHGVDDDIIATALFELKTGLVTPQQAALGQNSKTWGALSVNQRKAILQMRAIQNSIGNRLRKYSDKVKQYIDVCTAVANGQAPIEVLHQFEPAGRKSRTLKDVRRNSQLAGELWHSVGYQMNQVNPMRTAEGLLDKGATQMVANFNQAAFGQKNYAFQLMTIFDQLVLGSSYAGIRNLKDAAADRLLNKELAALLKSHRFVGERAGDVAESRAKAARVDPNDLFVKASNAAEGALKGVGSLAPAYDRERVNAEELALAVIYRYYNKNKKHLAGTSKQEFAKRVLKGDAPPEVIADAWQEIVTALSDVHGVNPFNLSTNIISESPNVGRQIGWFVKQPAREARLVMAYMAKGDWGALMTYYSMKAAIAGRVAIPVELMALMKLADPEGTEDWAKQLDDLSLYSKIDKLDTMSPKLQWGYMWWLQGGRNTPLQGATETLGRLISNKAKQLREEGELTIQPEELGSTANGALALVPGGKEIPIKPLIGAYNAYQEAFNGKEIKAFPKSATAFPFADPVFNRRQTTTVGEIVPNATQNDKLMYVLRGAFAPGVLKFKEEVTNDYQVEEMKELNAGGKDALYKFFVNRAIRP